MRATGEIKLVAEELRVGGRQLVTVRTCIFFAVHHEELKTAQISLSLSLQSGLLRTSACNSELCNDFTLMSIVGLSRQRFPGSF